MKPVALMRSLRPAAPFLGVTRTASAEPRNWAVAVSAGLVTSLAVSVRVPTPVKLFTPIVSVELRLPLMSAWRAPRFTLPRTKLTWPPGVKPVPASARASPGR